MTRVRGAIGDRMMRPRGRGGRAEGKSDDEGKSGDELPPDETLGMVRWYREGKKKWMAGPFIVVPTQAAAAQRAWKQKCDIGSPGKWQGGPDTMLGRPDNKGKWVSDYRWDKTVDFPISKK